MINDNGDSGREGDKRTNLGFSWSTETDPPKKTRALISHCSYLVVRRKAGELNDGANGGRVELMQNFEAKTKRAFNWDPKWITQSSVFSKDKLLSRTREDHIYE